MIAVVVAVALAASPAQPNPTGVAVTRRSGVNARTSLAHAEAVKRVLGLAADTRVDDLTSCAGRLPCLVSAARERHWQYLVSVEAASVLDDAILNVVLLSIEEDGKKLAEATAQAPEATLDQQLAAPLAKVKQALEAALEPVTVAGPTEPPPEVKPAQVLPPPPPVVPVATVSSSKPGARWVPLVPSLLITVGGAIAWGASAGIAAQLRTGTFTTDGSIDALVVQGKTLQALGVSGVIAGSALTAASLALALLWPDAPVVPVATLTAGGAWAGIEVRR
ncbi:MAG: hypothetical protein U0228_25155 [Myxococcaceae bacterium]